MLLLTKSTLHFINLKTIFSHNVKSGIEGWVKNWNEVVISAMASMHHSHTSLPNAYTFPCCRTPLSNTPRRQWGLSDIDPPSPDEARDYEECKDQTAIVIDDEYSDVENVAILLLWLRDQPNVWSVPKGDLVHALTEITKVVYPTFTTLDNICPNMPVFSIASQCLSWWCHSMGSTAIALLECYLASDLDTNVEQMCDALLHKQAFSYEDLDSHSLEKAFCSAFILQLLANTHLHSCARSVDVPALGLAPKPYMARGTIMLCVAALEHAIKQVKSKFVSTDAMGKG
ncbi:hypothetical protein BKA83DRAFT_4500260 [Pisolithus microcarpus]|nr:hypothetical protein BKA83DRAFT_4500260 [Pisolithus microcarpus]